MKLMTTLLASAFLLTAIAPTGSALCIGGRGCAEVNLKGTEAVLALAAPGGIGDPLNPDADGDSIPDAAEYQLCGRPVLSSLVNGGLVPGECRTTTDYYDNGVQDLIDAVWQAFNTVYDIVDLDRDNVPDALEPGICQVQNVNDDGDGRCEGSNYFPPF